jgi:preprotein translocase subunit SecD
MKAKWPTVPKLIWMPLILKQEVFKGLPITLIHSKQFTEIALTKFLTVPRKTRSHGLEIPTEYARAKELNLGLDLQGGMSVTMEVELTGLLRSMSNNSRDPQFLKALEEANKQKANSDC